MSDVKWGGISYLKLPNGSFQARAWVTVRGVPGGTYRRAQSKSKLAARRKLEARINADVARAA